MSQESIIERILKSVFYSSSMKKATRLTKNSKGIMQLLTNAFKKLKDNESGSALSGAKLKFLSLANLLKSYATGEYRDVELKNIAIILGSFIYFISPIDLIPDFLPFVGFGDDIALLAFVYNSLNSELEKFELWEINKNINV